MASTDAEIRANPNRWTKVIGGKAELTASGFAEVARATKGQADE